MKEELREKIARIITNGKLADASAHQMTDAILALHELQQALALAGQVGKLEKPCGNCGGEGTLLNCDYSRHNCPTCHGSKTVPLEPGDVDIVKWVAMLKNVQAALKARILTHVSFSEESMEDLVSEIEEDALAGVRVK